VKEGLRRLPNISQCRSECVPFQQFIAMLDEENEPMLDIFRCIGTDFCTKLVLIVNTNDGYEETMNHWYTILVDSTQKAILIVDSLADEEDEDDDEVVVVEDEDEDEEEDNVDEGESSSEDEPNDDNDGDYYSHNQSRKKTKTGQSASSKKKKGSSKKKTIVKHSKVKSHSKPHNSSSSSSSSSTSKHSNKSASTNSCHSQEVAYLRSFLETRVEPLFAGSSKERYDISARCLGVQTTEAYTCSVWALEVAKQFLEDGNWNRVTKEHFKGINIREKRRQLSVQLYGA